VKHVHWILADPYNYSILIYVGTWNQYKAYCKKRFSLDMGDQVNYGGEHATISNDTAEFSSIWIPKWSGETYQINTLSHELNHSCFKICKRVGIKVREGKKNEAFCYLQGMLLGRALDTLNSKGGSE